MAAPLEVGLAVPAVLTMIDTQNLLPITQIKDGVRGTSPLARAGTSVAASSVFFITPAFIVKAASSSAVSPEPAGTLKKVTRRGWMRYSIKVLLAAQLAVALIFGVWPAVGKQMAIHNAIRDAKSQFEYRLIDENSAVSVAMVNPYTATWGQIIGQEGVVVIRVDDKTRQRAVMDFTYQAGFWTGKVKLATIWHKQSYSDSENTGSSSVQTSIIAIEDERVYSYAHSAFGKTSPLRGGRASADKRGASSPVYRASSTVATDSVSLNLMLKDRRGFQGRSETDAISSPLTGYLENVRREVIVGEQGAAVEVRAISAEPQVMQRVVLHSNIGGIWHDHNEPMQYIGDTGDGRGIYQIEVNVNDSFDYTFRFEYRDRSIRWAELPFGNGHVQVFHRFLGEIDYVQMEFGPLVKVGGQGDVGYALPKAMVGAGARARVFIPYFTVDVANNLQKRGIATEDLFDKTFEVRFPASQRVAKGHAKKATIDGIQVYMLALDSVTTFAGQTVNVDWFKRPYQGQENEFYESIILVKAAAQIIQELGPAPKIVNASDHQTALMPLLLRLNNYFSRTGSVFTIHNICYQGEYGSDFALKLDLNGIGDLIRELDIENIDENVLRMLMVKSGKLNFMAVPAGVAKLWPQGNYINTVSNTYASDIKRTYFEVDMLLQQVGNRFGGILNGIDFNEFNPATDSALRERFSIEHDNVHDIRRKRAINWQDVVETLNNPQALQALNIPLNKVYGRLLPKPNRPSVGYVGRLVDQKHVDIIAEMLQAIQRGIKAPLEMDLVILGTGDAILEQEMIAALQGEFPGVQVIFICAYNEALARKIYGSVDMLLVPSDFEPCGLVQMIAMRYGAVPIVRATGGLADTVFEGGNNWTGFRFAGVSRTFDRLPQDYFVWLQNAVAARLMEGIAIGDVVSEFSAEFGFTPQVEQQFRVYVAAVWNMLGGVGYERFSQVHNAVRYYIVDALRGAQGNLEIVVNHFSQQFNFRVRLKKRSGFTLLPSGVR